MEINSRSIQQRHDSIQLEALIKVHLRFTEPTEQTYPTAATDGTQERKELPVLHSGVVDDDEGRRRRLLAGLELCALIRRLGEHLRRVEVVDARLEEAGLQRHTQNLLRLQLQLVEGLAHPGEDGRTFWAAEDKRSADAGGGAGGHSGRNLPEAFVAQVDDGVDLGQRRVGQGQDHRHHTHTAVEGWGGGVVSISSNTLHHLQRDPAWCSPALGEAVHEGLWVVQAGLDELRQR